MSDFIVAEDRVGTSLCGVWKLGQWFTRTKLAAGAQYVSMCFVEEGLVSHILDGVWQTPRHKIVAICGVRHVYSFVGDEYSSNKLPCAVYLDEMRKEAVIQSRLLRI